MREWLEKPENMMRVHKSLKWFWFVVAIFSILPLGPAKEFRSSIAVVVFISIYANYVSHWSTERAIDAQLEARSNSSQPSDSRKEQEESPPRTQDKEE